MKKFSEYKGSPPNTPEQQAAHDAMAQALDAYQNAIGETKWWRKKYEHHTVKQALAFEKLTTSIEEEHAAMLAVRAAVADVHPFIDDEGNYLPAEAA